MRVKLAYGRKGLVVDLPDEGTTVVEPEYVPGLPDEKAALGDALRNPLGTSPLREKVRPEHGIAVSVCDLTRPMPSSRVLPVLLEELSHVPDEKITILIATGTHRPNTHEELVEMLGEEVVKRYRIVNHSAFEKEDLREAGRTSSGIPILLNRHWLESDFRITTGFIEPHFFAGFSGGPKMVAPGLAGFETILGLHGASFIAHSDATFGKIEGNPIHDAIREISRRTGVDFNLDVTLNRDHRITSVYAGELFNAHAAGCEFVRRTAMRPVREPFDVVITTNSGYPLDLNLYQSVKGMSAASRVVREGGVILCAAECSDGMPEHGHYASLLRSESGPRQLLEKIHGEGFGCHDQWQVQVQAQIQLKARVFLKCSSRLSPEEVRAAHLEPVERIEDTLEELLADFSEPARICVLPQGPQTIPYLEATS